MEAVCSCDTFISTYKSSWRYNSEDQQRHYYRLQPNFTSRNISNYCNLNSIWKILYAVYRSFVGRNIFQKMNVNFNFM
jgi:hypothetical protein